jgi:preprotein translocase subunit SecB
MNKSKARSELIVQPKIRLISTQVADLNYSSNTLLEKDLSEGAELKLKDDILVNNHTPTMFIIRFHVEIRDKEKRIDFSMNYHAIFKCEQDVTEEFLRTPFVASSAPAIAFPYLRSFITTFTSNAGLKPLYLPTINFAQSYANIKKEINEIEDEVGKK